MKIVVIYGSVFIITLYCYFLLMVKLKQQEPCGVVGKLSIAITLLSIVAMGCGNFAEKSPERKNHEYNPENDTLQIVQIGAIQALTGNSQRHGENVRDGILLAIRDINTQGGIQGKKLEVLFEDEQCDPSMGISAMRKLVEVNNVKVIIGPTCSGTAMAIAPIAEEKKVIMFTPIASIVDLKYAGEYIFRNRVAGDKFSYKIAEFAFQELHARTAAILYINLDNGVSYKDTFKERFVALGGKVLGEESYEQDAIEHRTQLAKLKTGNPDVLYIAGQDHENAVKQARELGITAQIIGPLTMETPELLKVAGDAAEGIYYSYSSFDTNGSKKMEEFGKKYHEQFGKDAEAFAANAYDAAMILANALKECDAQSDIQNDLQRDVQADTHDEVQSNVQTNTRTNTHDDVLTECIRDYLYAVEGYEGVSGTTTFDEYGEVSQPLIIKTVKNGKFVKVPADEYAE